MGLKGKLVGEFEVRSSADQLHNQCRHKPYQINTFSDVIQECELVEGNFGHHGVLVRWHYTLPDGTKCKAIDRVEFNDETNEITWIVLEGDLMDDYTSFVISVHPIARPGQPDLVKWTCDYEKRRDDVPHPFQTLGMLLNVSGHMEVEHLKET